MALSRNNLFQQTSTVPFGTGAFTTSTFTPANGSLCIVRIACSAQTDSGLRGTHIRVDNSDQYIFQRIIASESAPGWSYGSAVFMFYGRGASIALRFTTAGSFDVHDWRCEVYEYAADFNPSIPIRQVKQGTSTSVDAASITLDAAPLPTSEVLAFLNVVMGSGSNSVTPGSDFTEHFDIAISSWTGYQAQSRLNSTSTTVGWQDVNATGTWGGGEEMIAIEIDAGPVIAWTTA